MTNEQINAAIAKVCGWEHFLCRDLQGNPWPAPPRDYCKDLNAMHEAEKHSLSDNWNVYINQLAKATGAEDSCDNRFFCATARHRAEAFLRTLDKWEEA